jgi:signal transduction histidine kinase/CheY-like chemotaxis protein
VLLLLAAALPVLLLSGVMFRRERMVVREARIALLDARLDEVGHTLEAIYRGYRDDAVRAAGDRDVIAFCAGSPRSRARGSSSMQRLLDVFRSADPALRGAGILDRTGEVIAATERALIGMNLSERAHVRRALAGIPAVSDVYVSMPATGRIATVAFTAPIRAPGGNVIGVYHLWLRAEELWDVMRAANGTAGAGSFFSLVDRHGFRVGPTLDQDLLFHPTVPVPEDVARGIVAEQRFRERTEDLIHAVVPFPSDEVKGRARALFEHLGHLVVAHHYDGLDATLIGHVPMSEVNVGAVTLIPRVLPAFLFGLVLVAAGSTLLIRHVVWPIRRMSAAAVAIERGELDANYLVRLDAHSPQQDEIGGLARAFTSMAGALSERDRTLRQQNRDLELKQRALAILTACNQALVRASDEPALLQAVCDVIVRNGGYRMCWIGFAEEDERKSVRTVARAGHEEGYVAAADIVWADEQRGSGPVGRAIRTGKAVVLRDLASDASFARWAPAAVRRGYASLAAVPIVSEGGVRLGALAIYASEVGAFDDPRNIQLLGDLAADVAYGVIALRGRTERLEMTARLLQADRMVAVGTLAAGVAHEINNPLAYALSAVEYQREELNRIESELPPGRVDEMKAACADASDGLKRVTTIVRDLKTFSRADEESRGAVDLHLVLDSTVSIAVNEIKHRARLVKHYGNIPAVDGNESRIGQVFLNLLINASQAIPEGRADENEVAIATSTDEAGRVVVEVRDTGTGIDPAIARHVFDPFFTTKPLGVGTGLGLFVCQNIIRTLGGEIAIRSVPGKGTVVRVVLLSAPARQPRTPAARSERAVEVGRRGRVLVVDDEPAVGYAIRRLLQNDHDVAALTSASDAQQRLAGGERFDVILCDLMMPVMSGMELYEAVLTLDPSQAARFVLLTGGAFTQRAREFVERWPHSRMEKPLDAEDLRKMVREVMARE